MIWRLIATVMAMTDTGSIAIVSDHHDWPSERACWQAVEAIYSLPKEPMTLNGHTVTVKVSASCRPVAP